MENTFKSVVQMGDTFNPFTRKPKDKYEGRHVYNGWPHFSSVNGNCLCMLSCCLGKSGCHCKQCAHVDHEPPLRSTPEKAAKRKP